MELNILLLNSMISNSFDKWYKGYYDLFLTKGPSNLKII